MQRNLARLTAIAVASLTWIAPAVSRAQPVANEPRCKTTTTVDCTGTAAPLAVPWGDPVPVAPAPVVPPLPVAPPAPMAPAPVASPPQVAPTPVVPLFTVPLPENMRTVLDENGQLVVERRTRLGRPAVWKAGLGLFLATPVIAAIGSGIDQGSNWSVPGAGIAFAPIVGSFVNAGFSESGGRKFGWTMSGLVQASGFVMFLVGLGTGPEKIERFPVRFTAGPTNGGASVGVNGAF